jgi:hypothetical protein
MSMPGTLLCPHCHQSVSYGAEHMGQTLGCPYCPGAITFPAAAHYGAPPSAAPVATAIPLAYTAQPAPAVAIPLAQQSPGHVPHADPTQQSYAPAAAPPSAPPRRTGPKAPPRRQEQQGSPLAFPGLERQEQANANPFAIDTSASSSSSSGESSYSSPTTRRKSNNEALWSALGTVVLVVVIVIFRLWARGYFD